MTKDTRFLLPLVLVLVGALLLGAVPVWATESQSRGRSLGQVRKALEQELLSLAEPGFVGIGHSEAEGEVIVFVEDEQAKQRVPRSFSGYPVRTEVTGRIQVLSTQVTEPLAGVSPERRGEVSPLVGGISLSAWLPPPYYAGTLGMVTFDDKILSNAHVIAMEPDTDNFLALGTDIIQPGSADGGRSGAKVGELEAYIPIDFDPGAENYADAAIGSIDGAIDVSYGEQFGEEGNYWIEGWTEVSLGDTVRKSGRTTGVSTGQVLMTNYAGKIDYGDKEAYFMDQILVAQDNYSFAGAGDSGSAVDRGGQFAGLVFAGVENYVVVCKAEHIIDGLGIAVEPMGNQYSLTVSTGEGGEVTDPGEGRFIYTAETVVPLVAEADEHYHFVEWTGDVGAIGNRYDASTTITMNGNYRITANFGLDPGWCSLTISSTPGGLVTTPGEDIFVYAANTSVPLIGEPDEVNHYHFGNWTGEVNTIADIYAASTNITMYDSYSITANFELDEGWYSLTISSTEGGEVITPGEGISVHAANTSVNLVAEPNEGYQFLKWTGDVSTIDDIYAASTDIAMNASYSIAATFKTFHPEPVMATLTISSTEGGDVIDPGEGPFSYPLGFEVNLVAEAASGYQFTYWSGNVSTFADVDAAETTVIVNGDYSITANFRKPALLQCFIATAAYGTPTAKEIGILRDFRDEYLVTNPMGRILVDLYYRVSPPIAGFITEHPNLKPIVRAGLLPAVAISAMAVNATPVEKIVVIGLLALISLMVAIWAMRRRDIGPEHA